MTSGEQLDTLPAGGVDPSRFDWREAWYPVYYLQDLDRSRPTPFTLLDRNIVIWWDRAADVWRVFDDRCPHRLASLSEGRIAEDGLLECPYHGWAFSGKGDCDRIPQQLENGAAETSARACATSLPATAHQGLLFVYAGQPENAVRVAVPTIEPLEDGPEEWVCLDTFRDLPYDALTLLENVLDSSHLPYTHHRSVGNRVNAGPVELEVVESDRQGFRGVWAEGPRRGTLGRQDTRFVAPGQMWHDLTSRQFGRTVTAVYATPIRKGECRLFARFPFKFASKLPAFFIQLTPRWYSHIGQNAILEDDQIFLHHQERALEQLGGSSQFARAFYLPTKADRFVFELRQWVNTFGAEPFSESRLAAATPRYQLLDRYYSHTVHCASCRTALANIQRLRIAAAILTLFAWAAIPLLAFGMGTANALAAVVLTGVSLACGGLWFGLGRLERRFYDGREVPPRNRIERSPERRKVSSVG
jgi:phenylpropionate dioxygenase-like ring-hydroxylating dioxygenase large terminal subunit